MRLFKKLRRYLDYLNKEQVELVHQAYELALQAHRGQKRVDGEPYITHPVNVACILAEMHMDHHSIMAGLLHDVLEDTSVNKQQLTERFSEEIAELVDGVSKLTNIHFDTKREAQAENFCKMVMAMARDIRVIIIKLADRLHNMRTIKPLSNERKRRIAKETLEIHAPIARRLGMHDVCIELEDLGFNAYYPSRYRVLKQAVEKARGNRKKVLNRIEKALKDTVKKKGIKQCAVIGREKHLYSIYRKMRDKRLTLKQVMDVYAFRLITSSEDDCYRLLGAVHALFKPVPGRFKDYIAMPKSNGYQSLHTTLFGPYGLPIEMQIRTTDMDHMAMSGIAAHWLYKTPDATPHESQLSAERWVHSLLELQRRAGDNLEFIETVKVDLFPDEVYVFTPKGRIFELPAEATAIDFAYAVHTDVGNTCVAVKVDHRLAPLSLPLLNGQTVEIITNPTSRPNPAWLDFVVTSKARSCIRHYLKGMQQTESVELGMQMLIQALANINVELHSIPDEAMDFVLAEANLSSEDALYEDIGLGTRMPALVANRLVHAVETLDLDTKEEMPPEDAPIVVKGTEGMLVNMSACCFPLPGDPIIGMLTDGQGIEVHKEGCHHVDQFRDQMDRTMVLQWAESVEGEFATMIHLQVINQRGVLAKMAILVADANANIEDISVLERRGQDFLVSIKLLVGGRKQLARVIKQLRTIPEVMKISRDVLEQ